MNTPTNFEGLVNEIINIINLIIPALFAVVFVYVLWKIIDAWVIHGGDETKVAEGKQLVLVAVIVLVLMLSAWGIVAMIRQSVFG